VEELKPIRVFLEVASQRSFAGAARTLGMTPASITRIVAKLEGDLGQQLLVRTTRHVSLTSAGALVAARYAPVVDDFDQITTEITSAHVADAGRLRLNVPISMGVRLLPGLIKRYADEYPNVALDIRMTDTLVNIMEEDCDLAIRISGPPTDKSTIWRKICEVPRHVVAAPGFFAGGNEPDEPQDILPEDCLAYSESGTKETWELRRGPAKRTLRTGTRVVSNNGDFLYSLVADGVGVAILPDFIVNDGLARGEVVRVLEEWEPSSLWLTLYYPPYEQLPPLVAGFSDFFEAYVRGLNGLSH